MPTRRATTRCCGRPRWRQGASSSCASCRCRRGAGPPGPRAHADRRARVERAFLGLCLALPDRGRAALAEVDPDEDFTTPRTRRAAQWLREHFDAPLEGLPRDDPELSALVGELVVRAAGPPP